MGIFGGSRAGSWWTKSESDPRWDMSCCGPFSMWGPPQKLKDMVAAKEKELGVPPPDDLEYGCVKD